MIDSRGRETLYIQRNEAQQAAAVTGLEIPARLDLVEQAIEGLHDAIGMLLGRLSPVMRIVDADKEVTDIAQIAAQTPIGRQIEHKAVRIQQLSALLHTVINSLEI